MFIVNEPQNVSALRLRSPMCGTVPRDYSEQPLDMFAAPSAITLIPRSEWDARIQERKAQKSGLKDKAKAMGFRVLDQNGQGCCWAYSVATSIMLRRMAANQGMERLSAHAVACKIKNFRDQGGWCGLSQDFMRSKGCPTVAKWPEKSMSRQYDNEETWKEAMDYRITDDVVVLGV